ncbi:SMP-30/gluconolactonase/LRE family protein [Lewinella sp. W8]|uniref:SMP-30/gluconolactonase/LRE family protein n=1 Tax=Lewinella sp. W8 TaxID=2528208 RepID=UPI0010675917|nr:SMP-30/gluconolactonase/LRE family protein [Lewinella sp. W8]MTB51061.1 SMP-30/gluconolactonase/LRE family protein [Lewinella sp. W8]
MTEIQCSFLIRHEECTYFTGMKGIHQILLPLVFIFSACADQNPPPPAAVDQDGPELSLRVEAIDDRLTQQLFGAEPSFEVLFGGMEWSEGPLVLPDGSVICSDVPNNQILRWTPENGKEIWLQNSGNAPDDYSSEPGSNGLLLDQDGRLLLCQHGARSVSRMKRDWQNPAPEYEVLAENFGEKRFNSPNDLTLAPDGSILFTDPIYGLPGRAESKLRELDYCGVFRLTPTGMVQLLTKAYSRPNGIGISPDGNTLYVANSDGDNAIVTATQILDTAFTLGPVDTLINATNLTAKEVGYPDGLAVGKNGRIFATAPGGVWVMEPDGTLIGKIRTGLPVSNVTLSPTEDYLYLTSDFYLIRVKLNHP